MLVFSHGGSQVYVSKRRVCINSVCLKSSLEFNRVSYLLILFKPWLYPIESLFGRSRPELDRVRMELNETK